MKFIGADMGHICQEAASQNMLFSGLSEPDPQMAQAGLVCLRETAEKLDLHGISADPVWLRRIVNDINCAISERLMFPCASWVVEPRFKRRILFWQTLFIEITPIDVDDPDFGVITQLGDAAVLIDESCWRVVCQTGDQITAHVCEDQNLALTVVRSLDLPSALKLWTTRLLADIDDVIPASYSRSPSLMDAILDLVEARLTIYVTPHYAISAVCAQLFQSRAAGHAVAQAVLAGGNNLSGHWLEKMAASATALTDVSPEDTGSVPLLALLARTTCSTTLMALQEKLRISAKMLRRLNHLEPMSLLRLSQACPQTHAECVHYMTALADVLSTILSLAKMQHNRQSTIGLCNEVPGALRALARVELHRAEGIRTLDADYTMSLMDFSATRLWRPLPDFSFRHRLEPKIPSEQVALLLRLYIRALAEQNTEGATIRPNEALDWMISEGITIDRNQARRGWDYVAKNVSNWHAELATMDTAEHFLAIPPWKCKLMEHPCSTWWPKLVTHDSPYGVRPLVTPAALQEEGKMMEHCVLSYAPTCARGHARIFSIYEIDSGRRVATVELARHDHAAVWVLAEMRGYRNAELMHAMEIAGDPLNEIVSGLVRWYNMVSKPTLLPEQFDLNPGRLQIGTSP